VAVAGALAWWVLGGESPEAASRDVAVAYLRAWGHGDDRAAAAQTNRPQRALEALKASRAGLDGARVDARLTSWTADAQRASGRARVAWRIPRIGTYGYEVRLAAVRDGDRWTIAWADRAVHPRLDADTRLGTEISPARRGRILDRAGRVLVGPRQVVDVAVKVDDVESPRLVAGRLAALVDVDARRLRKAIAAAPRGRFVPVITLRRRDYEPIAARLEAVPGISLLQTKRHLAPTRDFARATLGAVGPATAEQVERSKGRLHEGDLVGQGGFEQAFDESLSGAPDRAVVIRDRLTGQVMSTLRRWGGRRGTPLKTTLDMRVQQAAERALDGQDAAALVAQQPSTGDILAVANRPTDTGYDRALLGRYPPGSTFKVVTTAALLRRGLDPARVVDCPPTVVVDGKSFRNFEGGAADGIDFREDFARSCNTAFISLRSMLTPADLVAVARDFGLGRKLQTGVPAADASVPAASGDVGKAAAMIGQDRILASPLGMAGVAATVAAGRWRSPRLLPSAPSRQGPALPAGDLAALRSMMRQVVTGGTGTALSAVGGDVYGKSGTAEYGGGDPPPTHAWFIAYRGDVAVSVLVENGSSGGHVAAPLVRRFFEALDGR
jgi:cell division protein FtsI/penicillin-binding protein 2